MAENPYQPPETSEEVATAGREDPLVTNSRREALVVVGMWLTSFAWTVGYCAAFGYGNTRPTLVLGVPSWVMWGIFAPWTICTCVSSCLAVFFIRDADLGEDPEEKRGEHEAEREIGNA